MRRTPECHPVFRVWAWALCQCLQGQGDLSEMRIRAAIKASRLLSTPLSWTPETSFLFYHAILCQCTLGVHPGCIKGAKHLYFRVQCSIWAY